MIIDREEELIEVYDFLNDNIIYKIGDVVKNDTLYYEVCSIKPDKLLIDKKVLNDEVFFKIFKKYIESRKMLLDQDYRGVYNYNITTMQGGSEINIDHGKCNIKLFTSISDKNVLVPSDREFLMELLDLIDNGYSPIIMAKDNEFYIMFGNTLTIKFNWVLLKYIEEYSVNCKYNRENSIKLERKV